ncbi:MAG: hypothetical protein K6F77_08260 [Lachnospiraceae bacterium]|nr:hypothetical protein [Lachnospiraceae bacterium]
MNNSETKHNLFFVTTDTNDNIVVKIIRYNSTNEKTEYLKKDGDQLIKFDSSLFDWWKEKISYVEGDYIDVAFLYDTDDIKEFMDTVLALNKSSNTVWTQKVIEDFIKFELKDSKKVFLISNHNNDRVERIISISGNEDDPIDKMYLTNVKIYPNNKNSQSSLIIDDSSNNGDNDVGNKNKSTEEEQNVQNENEEIEILDSEVSPLIKYFRDKAAEDRKKGI